MSLIPAAARARFAKLIAAAPGVDDARVIDAFASVPRERFAGPGPWRVLGNEGYVEPPATDPAELYQDVVVALMPEKRINNGQPTLHARCLSSARVRPGEKALHIGCGSGYYSAVLAELLTDTGSVVAWDIEPALAARATLNLQDRPNVSVELRDATSGPVPSRDLIYVCAGCTRPIRSWAEALADRGRLIFPLTPGWDFGAILMVTRYADAFAARFLCRCAFIPCVGGSDGSEAASVRQAFAQRSLDEVASLRFGAPPTEASVWLSGSDWWLSTVPPGRLH